MRKRSIWEWVFLKMGKRSPENEAVQNFRKWRDTKWSGVGWAGALFHQPQNCQKYFPAHKFIFSAATRRFLYLDPSFLHHPVTICLNKAARLTPHFFLQRRFKSKVRWIYILIMQTSWNIFEQLDCHPIATLLDEIAIFPQINKCFYQISTTFPSDCHKFATGLPLVKIR